MIYFDNAATSFPKPDKVYEEIDRCMKEYCANPGRGGHSMSIKCGRQVFSAREVLCDFFNIQDPLRLCFTKNATESLNIAIKGVLKKGDHVITTCMEHNSVLRPLKTLERDRGIEITIVYGNEFGQIKAEDIKYCIKENTKLIVCTSSSNVNGMIVPVKEIGKIACEKDIMFLLDASQGAGTFKIDVEELNVDMMAFPGHKCLLGPQGIGGLYVKEGININSYMEGGTGSSSENLFQPEEMPDFLESGTLNTPAIVGLLNGVEFINNFGLENINLFKHELIKRIYYGIQNIKGIKLYSTVDKNSGIVAFNFKGVDSTEISYILDKTYNIATRAGLHCAPLAHKALGTLKTGIVRVSVGCFNTQQDVESLLWALNKISNNI